uniref:Uncharacterized protein n=1 Tax=Nothobranchius furzeri TaxID=105023 RepID=A0A8C6LU60_NOTFU
MEQTVMGVFVIQKEGVEPEDDPEDIGVLIEGVETLTGVGNIAQACALLFGLIYCLNLSYPPELKCTFEVFQKILLNLDGQKLSSKARFLRNQLKGFWILFVGPLCVAPQKICICHMDRSKWIRSTDMFSSVIFSVGFVV